MAYSTPYVRRNQLVLPEAPTHFVCKVGTPAWFDWLATASSFRYYSQQFIYVGHTHYRPYEPISVRREKRRQTYLWYAYRRDHGRLHKRYVGTTAALTTARLDEIALRLNLPD